MMKPGDQVKIERTKGSLYANAVWWPASGLTGTVQKVFANGSVKVACHQLPNHSDDKMISKTFKPANVTLEIIPA